MLAFVDESGDTGLKIGRGSSRYFCVGLVLFNDYDAAAECDKGIDELRTELRLADNFEFHFKENSDRVRWAFFQAVRDYDYFYFGIVVDKALLYGPGFHYKEPFYKYTCGLVFENAKTHLENAIVVIDGSGNRDFRASLGRYLKARANSAGQKSIKKVKVAKSKGNNLVQLADMVTGSINRSLNVSKRHNQRYRETIRHREIYVQVWPKTNPTPIP